MGGLGADNRLPCVSEYCSGHRYARPSQERPIQLPGHMLQPEDRSHSAKHVAGQRWQLPRDEIFQ